MKSPETSSNNPKRTLLEKPDDPEAMTVYTQKNKYIDEQIIALKAEIEVNNDNPQKIDELNERLRILNKEKVEVSANYPGNWTGLFQERLNSFIYFVRFKAVRE
jgi:hypothetical protein